MGRRSAVDGQRALVGRVDGGPAPRVTPARRRRHRQPGPSRSRPGDLGAAEELLDRVLGRDRVDRQAGPQLEAGDLAEPRVDLPVPVVRGVDLLAQRRGVEDEVVRRPVEAGREPAEDLAERLGRGRDVGVGGPPEVGFVAARARSRPRTASATRTGRRRRSRRPPRRAAPADATRRARAGRTGTPPRG